MHVVRSLAVLCLFAAGARAEPTHGEDTARSSFERVGLFSAPLILGGLRRDGDTSFVRGIRPEAIHAWVTHSGPGELTGRGFGVGGYAELLVANDRTMLGGGLTLTGYASPFAIAPSVGLYVRPSDSVVGLTAGVFIGIRPTELGVIDLPFGLRVEVREGLGSSAERSVMIGAQLDLPVLLGAGLYAIGELLN